MRSRPRRETSTGVGILPLRKPGILTLSDRSDRACSTAWCTAAAGTSTVRRTRFPPSSSTVVTSPFKQTPHERPSPYACAMRLFVLTRHGESELNVTRRVNGDPAVSVRLTERGRSQSIALGQQTANINLDACVVTRFGRTHETAALALGGRDVPMLEEPLLDDIYIGELEGRTL